MPKGRMRRLLGDSGGPRVPKGHEKGGEMPSGSGSVLWNLPRMRGGGKGVRRESDEISGRGWTLWEAPDGWASGNKRT